MNNKTGYDPREIANALLDIAKEEDIKLSNLTLNKILFFLHADYLQANKKKLCNLTFEAWQYGPVIPLLYHQFKSHGSSSITTRATRTDPSTGNKLVVEYSKILHPIISYLKEGLTKYSKLSPAALVELSHQEHGPWYQVWNGHSKSVGMKIPDSLILGYSDSRIAMRPNKYATIH